MALTRPTPVRRSFARTAAMVAGAFVVGVAAVAAAGDRADAAPWPAAASAGGATNGSAGGVTKGSAGGVTKGSAGASPAISPAALKRLPDDLRSSPRKLALVATFKAEAKQFGVPADLLMALAYTESGWRSTVVSKHGAVGICQLLPETASWLARDLLGQPNLRARDPEDNIRMGARLLRQLLRTFRTERLALAAYFDGHGTVTRSGVSAAAGRYAKVVQGRRSMFRGL